MKFDHYSQRMASVFLYMWVMCFWLKAIFLQLNWTQQPAVSATKSLYDTGALSLTTGKCSYIICIYIQNTAIKYAVKLS